MWDVIGHQRTVEVLKQALERGRMPHAWLFTGPAGVGKTHLALQLAKALNCTGSDPPDGTCLHCLQIEHATHPDVSIVERPEGKDSIAIQQVRELRDAASIRPYQGRTRVYIVAGAEALTPQAADALLKTLEEPQAQVVLILTAVDATALPQTVISRCRILPLQPIDRPTLEAALVARGLEASEAVRLARLAQGNVGWAVRATADPRLADQQDETIARLVSLLDLDLDARLALAESLTGGKKERASVRHLVELLAMLGRDLLFLVEGLQPSLVEGETLQVLERQARHLSLGDAHAFLHGLRLAMDRIDSNVDPRLALEALFVSLP